MLDPATFEVMQVSENVAAFPGLKASAVAGASFRNLVDEASFSQLASAVQTGVEEKQTLNLVIQSGNFAKSCSALVHRKGEVLFAEVLLPELVNREGRTFLKVYQEIKNVMTALGGQKNIEGFAAIVAAEMKRLSSFDKVMVYSFNPEWHGTVIAEEKEEGMDAYLGLRFPASDIPKPARDMYLKNPYRYIPNGKYQPSKLFPLLHPRTNAFTDLSASDLRSVAGVHLEYLKNMNITASLSLRLVHNGKLWGLISCHNRNARYLSFEELGLFELLSGIFSAQLSIILNETAGRKQQKLQEELTTLVPHLHEGYSLHGAIGRNAAALQSLLHADGIAYSFDGRIESFGQVPENDDLDRLFYWLQVQDKDELMHQPSLPRVFEEAASFAQTGSGILALPVVPSQGAFLVAFRPEAVEEVAWGGNPHEALQLENDGKTYPPRNSFRIWKQTVHQTARAWDEAELTTAEALKNVLGSIVLRRMHA